MPPSLHPTPSSPREDAPSFEPTSLNSYKVDIHFSSPRELEDSLAFLTKFHGPNQAYEILLHWRADTLKKEFLRMAVEGLDRMRRKNGSVLCYLPLCFEDALKITTFPHCSSCVLGETGHCQYPNQLRSYYPSPQLKVSLDQIEALSRADFASDCPPTWLIPTRRQVKRLVELFEGHGTVIDFGCGNGFLSGLLLKEGLSVPIKGIDPLVEPSLKHPLFQAQKNFIPPEPNKKWALFSSLADYRVPLQEAIKYRPTTLGMFVFTEVFGRGGAHFQGLWEKGKYEEKKVYEHFSFEQLEREGYVEIEREKMESPFFPNSTDFRVYSLEPASAPRRARETFELAPFPWEKTSAN